MVTVGATVTVSVRVTVTVGATVTVSVRVTVTVEATVTVSVRVRQISSHSLLIVTNLINMN